MKAADLLGMALDPRMTPDAVRVTTYYASLGDGEHPYDFDRLSELLEEAGEKRIRKALQRAERCGYLTRHHGGQRTDRFNFSPPQAAGQNLSPPQEAGETGFSPPQAAGETRASSSTPISPPSPPSKRGRAYPSDLDLERMRKYLGEHASAVDMLRESAEHPTTWAAAIYGKYGPSGTQLRVFGSLPQVRHPAVVATAMMDFATDGQPFDNRHFDGYMRKAIQDEHRKHSERGAVAGEVAPARRPHDKYEHLVEGNKPGTAA